MRLPRYRLMSAMVRNVMLQALENRFDVALKADNEIEWLSDNGSCYIAEKTPTFSKKVGLKPITTPVRSPQSNGMAESFVKTMKRDYVSWMPKPDARTALQNLAIAFDHYNESHPHSALKYCSPREFRQRAICCHIGRRIPQMQIHEPKRARMSCYAGATLPRSKSRLQSLEFMSLLLKRIRTADCTDVRDVSGALFQTVRSAPEDIEPILR